MVISKKSKWAVIDKVFNVLIVSCQASEGEPLAQPVHIKALALSAIAGGAKGLRLEDPENIKAVRSATKLPIIGLSKSKRVPEKERLKSVYITATFEEASEIQKAGADIVAIDGTNRARQDGLSLTETISKIHNQLNLPVLADISTVEEGVNAESCGADILSTTLYGYTEQTKLPSGHGPGLELLQELVNRVRVPVILEGRIWDPLELTKAFQLGAHAVVVGSAITRPQLITQRFVAAIPKHS